MLLLSFLNWVVNQMANSQNPLREDANPQEAIEPEQLTNIHTRRSVNVQWPNGAAHEYIQEEKSSMPGPDGTYRDTSTKHVHIDIDGNPINVNDLSQIWVSHTGLTITSREELAVCTSALHPNNLLRNIKVGSDGIRTADGGAICSYCQRQTARVNFVLCVLALGMLIGIIRGLGLF